MMILHKVMHAIMIHPGLVLMVSGTLVMMLPRPVWKIAGAAAPFAALWSLLKLTEETSLAFDLINYVHLELIRYDDLNKETVFAFVIVSIAACIYSLRRPDRYESGMSLILAGSAIGICLAGDLLSMAAFYIILSSACMLVIYSGHKKDSLREAANYIIIQTAAGGCLITGALIYIFHYGNDLANISASYGEACFMLMLCGIAAGIALPPLGPWLAGATQSSSNYGSVYIASYTIFSAVYMAIRLAAGSEYLMYGGAVMACYGSLMALNNNDIRRIAAYALICQTGIILISGAVAALPVVIILICVVMMAAGNAGCRGRTCRLISVTIYITAAIMNAVIMVECIIRRELASAWNIYALICWALGCIAVILRSPSIFSNEEENERNDTALLAIGTLIGIIGMGEISMIPAVINPEHVLIYAAYFAGIGAAYLLLGRYVKPDDRIMLDFDRIWRKPPRRK